MTNNNTPKDVDPVEAAHLGNYSAEGTMVSFIGAAAQAKGMTAQEAAAIAIERWVAGGRK